MIKNILCYLSAIALSGCATIMKDDSQPVAFSSEPDDAVVKLNSVARGKTPVTVMVKRSMSDTIISIEKDGYKTETFPLEKSLSAMTFGNIIFGGIIGIGVDAATGKNTDYIESVHVNLIPLTGSSSSIISTPPKSVNTDKLIEKRQLMLDYQNGNISAEEFLKLSKQN